MFCMIIFSNQDNFKFAMLLTSLRLASEQCHLLLNDNPALQLDAGALEELSKLHILSMNLSSCGLLSIPRQINLLKSLQHLNLQNNKLDKLPISLGELHLRNLNLQNNSFFQIPPQEIIDQGRRHVLSYLRERRAQGEKSCRAQLVVLGVNGAQNVVLQTLLARGQESNFHGRPAAHSGMDLYEWKPRCGDCHDSDDDITVSVLNVGMNWNQSHLYRLFLLPHYLYVVAYKIPNTRAGDEVSTLKVTLLKQLQNLQFHVPGTSVMLVAVVDDEDHDAALIMESVESAVADLVERQQSDIQQSGKTCTAKPIRLLGQCKISMLQMSSGHGTQDMRRVLIKHIVQASSYGAIVPLTFHEVERQIAALRTGRYWLSWEHFEQLCRRAGATPTASKVQRLSHSLEKHAYAKKQGLIQNVYASAQEASSFPLGGRESDACDCNRATRQCFVDPTHGISSVCRLQSVLRRLPEEFRYLKRLRRGLRNRRDSELMQVSYAL